MRFDQGTSEQPQADASEVTFCSGFGIARDRGARARFNHADAGDGCRGSVGGGG